MTTEQLKAEGSALECEVAYDTQEVYIDHMAILFGPYTYKLPTNLASKTVALPRECRVIVELKSCHAPKVIPPSYKVVVDGAQLDD